MRNVNWPGLAICALCVAVSLCYAVVGGLEMASTIWQSVAYSMLAIGSVSWEVLGLHRTAHLYRAGRYLAMTLCAVVLAFACAVSVSYELQYLATFQEAHVSIGASKTGNRASLEAERGRLQATIDKAGPQRAVAAVDGDLAGVKGHPRWLMSKACTNVTAPESEALCQRYGGLMAERGTAADVAAAQARIHEINAALQPLAEAGVADARSDYLSRWTGMSAGDARAALALVFIIFIHMGSMWGPFCFADPRGGAPLQDPLPSPLSRSPVVWNVTTPQMAVMPPLGLLDEPGQQEDDYDADAVEALWELEQERELLAALDAGRIQPAPPAEPVVPLDPKMRRAHDIIRMFVADCCSIYPGESDTYERANLAYDCFGVWQAGFGRRFEGQPVEMLDNTTFGQALKAILEEMGGGKKATKHGNAYWGMKLRPSVVQKATEEAKPVAEVKDQPRRLGGIAQDRRLMDDAPMAGTA